MQLLHHLADPLGDFISTSIGIGILVVNKDLPHPCGSEIIIIIIITITVNIIIIIIILFVAIRPARIHILNCECSSVVSSSIRILLIIISFYAFSVVVVPLAQMN